MTRRPSSRSSMHSSRPEASHEKSPATSNEGRASCGTRCMSSRNQTWPTPYRMTHLSDLWREIGYILHRHLRD